jgi:hypothetical protein
MKYICLGYLEPGKFENMSESERNTASILSFAVGCHIWSQSQIGILWP